MKNTRHLEPYRPRKGEPVSYRGEPAGLVGRTEGNLCWIEGSDAPFIWAFHDGVNAMHEWPSRNSAPVAPCPGE